MGAVMGAHREGSEIAHVPFAGGAEYFFFRSGVSRVDLAGEQFLSYIVYLHNNLPFRKIIMIQ